MLIRQAILRKPGGPCLTTSIQTLCRTARLLSTVTDMDTVMAATL
jgi:hypothetical protein